VKVEDFFRNFELFADATGSLAKMRDLVLHFAVRGKLVDHDSRDKPASALLASARAQREELVVARQIRSRPSAAVEADEQPFTLPNTWTWGRLSDVGYELGQKVPDRQFTYIDVGSIDSDKGRISDRVEKLEPNAAPSRARKLVARGTVIYSTVRPYLRNIAIVDEEFDPEPIASTAFGILHPFKGINSRYLFYWLRSGPFTAYVERGMKGMAYPAINDETLYSGYIPVPPTAEQTRIVAKVDELMALCDRLESQQQERAMRQAVLGRASVARFAATPTPANLELLFHRSYSVAPSELRKAILTLAFAGKLVPQDPKDEPAAVLLEKARAEKARLIKAGLVKKEPWAHKLEDATTLYELPRGWEWTHVSDVVEKVTVGFVGSMKEEYRPTGVPFLRSQNVRTNRYEPAGLTFISEEFHRSINKSTLRPGDVVVTRSGNVGVTCVIPESVPEANCSDLVVVKRPIALVPAFLSYFINSIAAGQIEARTVGIALTHFNTQSVAQMTVALPPLAEQRRIVERVDELMTLVDALENQLATTRTAGAALMEAVVAELTQVRVLL
jgi:type I restriction enzyme, S subunit